MVRLTHPIRGLALKVAIAIQIQSFEFVRDRAPYIKKAYLRARYLRNLGSYQR